MKDIFRSAINVIVWLGRQTDKSPIGMEVAWEIANSCKEYLMKGSSLENLSSTDPAVAASFGRFSHPSQYQRLAEFAANSQPRLVYSDLDCTRGRCGFES